MEWGASRILALRKHAGMTQAKFARWLGVSTKQVKYLEHQRRNPSGPTRRLLSILEYQLSIGGATAIQVLGSSLTDLKVPTALSEADAVADPESSNDGNGSASNADKPKSQAINTDVETPVSAPQDEAFVWS